jgi:hypothetical protein
MTNGLSYPKRNAAAGFIRPNGTFVHLQHGSHPSDARGMGTTLHALLKKGWIRKAGQGAYEGNFTPVTLRAIEDDIIKDYEDLKMAGDFGTSIDCIVLDHPRNKTSIQIPLQGFEEAGFDLRCAINKCQMVGSDLRNRVGIIQVGKSLRSEAGE